MNKEIFPGKSWLKFSNPEEAGWSVNGLNKVFQFYKKTGTDALLVIYNGVVLLSWGEVERRFLCHSMRKSLMNAMIGIYESKGKINLYETLRELQINDIPPLSELEKNAKVIDLLKSSSGIYLTAQYEGNDLKPERCSLKPGEKYFYNNWDFNALNTIFEKETGKKLFADFKKLIARPLQMEEFRITDGYYHLEKGKSIHPAYPLRMSAKDLARFGLLYLKKGKWKNKQLIPSKWIDKSTKPCGFSNDVTGSFGYLWFVSNDKFKKPGMYSSLGSGGQGLSVLPKENLVIVHRVNTYKWKNVSEKDRLKMIDLILKAKRNSGAKNPKLAELKSSNKITFESIKPGLINKLTGSYSHNNVMWKMRKIRKSLFLLNQYGDRYKMIPKSDTEFILEDSLRKLKIKYSKDKSNLRLILYRAPESKAVLEKLN